MKITSLKTNKIVAINEDGEVIIADDLHFKPDFIGPESVESIKENTERLSKLLLERQSKINFLETDKRYSPRFF